MLKFVLKALIWLLPGTIACYGIWLGGLSANPSRDSLGLYRMMPTTCNSMIFGTSRSAQGVNPSVLEEYAPSTGKWLNFSFNLGASPWNNSYVNAIEEKIACSIQADSGSTFLLFVDPWVLDEFTGEGLGSWFSEEWSDVCDMNPIAYARKKSNPLDVIGFGSGDNLLSVVGSSVPRQLRALIVGDTFYFENLGVQVNGWLPNNGKLTLDQKRASIQIKVDNYRREKVLGETWPAQSNLEYLERCIETIQRTVPGARILLLRPPTAVKMRQLEDEWFPEANRAFETLARDKHVDFVDTHYNWTSRNIIHFNDGHHMSIDGANEFSEFLATEIVSKPAQN